MWILKDVSAIISKDSTVEFSEEVDVASASGLKSLHDQT